MAPYKFMKAIMNNEVFDKYGDGTSSRDYTYIDDIVSGIVAAFKNKNNRKCEIYNLGNSSPITLNEFIKTCEKVCGKNAKFNILETQLGDVPHTYASIKKAQLDLDYKPTVKLEQGLTKLYNYLNI
jgi:UDP-glucuronate 4-epimerase